MARGVNKVILIGNLGGDPEVRYMPSGGAVANINVATPESRKDKNTGEKQERTEWHKVVLYNRLGEIAGEYLKKGAKVYIEGRIQTRKWQDKDGQDRYTTEIIASEMQMLDGRGGAGSFVPDGAPASSAAGRGGNAPSGRGQPAPAGIDDFDDDIPF